MVGIKRRAVSATAETLAGCSAPAHWAALALGRAAPCRASSFTALATAPARGETPVKGRMNQLANFFPCQGCVTSGSEHTALPSQAIPPGAALSSSEERASLAAEWDHAGRDLLVPSNKVKVENSLEEGAARGEAAVVELPLLKRSNRLMASSPDPLTPLPLHISPQTWPCVSRDKNSLSTWGSSPPECFIASQCGKQPSWEMSWARLLALLPCLLPFASTPAFPHAPGLPAHPCSPRGCHVPLINELHLHPKLITLLCRQRMRQLR